LAILERETLNHWKKAPTTTGMQHGGQCLAGKRPIKNFTEDGSRGFPKMFASKYCIASMMSSGGKASEHSCSLATE